MPAATPVFITTDDEKHTDVVSGGSITYQTFEPIAESIDHLEQLRLIHSFLYQVARIMKSIISKGFLWVTPWTTNTTSTTITALRCFTTKTVHHLMVPDTYFSLVGKVTHLFIYAPK